MKPSRSRPQIWPFVTLPSAAFIALIVGASGLSQEKTVPAPGIPPESFERHHANASGTSVAKSTVPQADQPAPQTPESDRQISYQVHYISLDACHWREAMLDRLKLIKDEVDGTAWMIDRDSASKLLQLAREDPTSNILQTPKVTAFENGHALIRNIHQQKYVSQVEKIVTSESIAFRPVVKEREVGTRVDVSGTVRANGTMVSADVRNSLVNFHNLTRKEKFREQEYSVQYQIPTTIDHHCNISCEIEDGSSLLISMGLRDQEARRWGAGGAASQMLQSVGLPPLPARTVTSELLVMITPLRILFEDETEPLGVDLKKSARSRQFVDPGKP